MSGWLARPNLPSPSRPSCARRPLRCGARLPLGRASRARLHQRIPPPLQHFRISHPAPRARGGGRAAGTARSRSWCGREGARDAALDSRERLGGLTQAGSSSNSLRPSQVALQLAVLSDELIHHGGEARHHVIGALPGSPASSAGGGRLCSSCLPPSIGCRLGHCATPLLFCVSAFLRSPASLTLCSVVKPATVTYRSSRCLSEDIPRSSSERTFAVLRLGRLPRTIGLQLSRPDEPSEIRRSCRSRGWHRVETRANRVQEPEPSTWLRIANRFLTYSSRKVRVTAGEPPTEREEQLADADEREANEWEPQPVPLAVPHDATERAQRPQSQEAEPRPGGPPAGARS
jgi:hypothetical protein